MSYFDSDIQTWTIVNVVLTGIPIKPLFIIWLISLCLARRKGDHARVGFTWLKLVFPFYILALLLYVVSSGLYIVLVPWFEDRYDSYSDYDDDTYTTLYNIEIRVGSAAQFFDDVATALLLITLAEIGSGFLYVLSQTRTEAQRALRWVTISIAGVGVVVAIARLGQVNSAWTRYFDYQSGKSPSGEYFAFGNFDRDLRTARQLGSAVTILYWFVALGMVAWAGVVVHRVKGIAVLRSSGIIFLVATILLFIRYTWQLAAVAAWVLPNKELPLAFNAVDPILTAWLMFIVLVLLFVVGIRKKKGLWTTHQPWMDNMNNMHQVAPAQSDWVYGGGYPPQQQQVYQPYPPQQHVYPMPQERPQGWARQQPMQQYVQEVHGHHSPPPGNSPPYVPREGVAQELPNGEQREK